MSNTTPKFIDILNQSSDLLLGDRLVDHGPPEENHQRIADYWNIKLASVLTRKLTPADVAIMMVLLKIARTENDSKEDTFVDMASYSALAGAFVKQPQTEDSHGIVSDAPDNTSFLMPVTFEGGKS